MARGSVSARLAPFLRPAFPPVVSIRIRVPLSSHEHGSTVFFCSAFKADWTVNAYSWIGYSNVVRFSCFRSVALKGVISTIKISSRDLIRFSATCLAFLSSINELARSQTPKALMPIQRTLKSTQIMSLSLWQTATLKTSGVGRTKGLPHESFVCGETARRTAA